MNKKRIFIYLGLLVSCFVLVIYKQGVIVEQRKQEVMTFFSEWGMKGRPVVVDVLKRQDVELSLKITVVRVSEKLCRGYVPEDTQKRIKKGQTVYADIGAERITGMIVTISQEVDLVSGMFFVEVSFDKSLPVSLHHLVVYVDVGMVEDVICIASDVLERQHDGTYVVWVSRDNKAYKQEVVLQQRNGYGAIIQEGLKEGDLLIVKGFASLYENEKVNILNKEVLKEK